MTDFVIDPVFQAFIRPLDDVEFHTLEANCIEHGIREPLQVWRGVLVDGHNRKLIADTHNLPYTTVELPLESKDEVLLYMAMNQIGRRNLDEVDRLELAMLVKPVLARIAAARQASAGTANFVQFTSGVRNDTTGFESNVPTEASVKNQMAHKHAALDTAGHVIVGSLIAGFEKGRVRDVISKIANVKPTRVTYFEAILANDPDAIQRIRDGETTITTEYNRINKLGKVEEEKVEIHKRAEKFKDVDLGVQTHKALYSKSGMKSALVINDFEPELVNILKTVNAYSKAFVVISNSRDLPAATNLADNYKGTIALVSDKNVRYAVVFSEESLAIPAIINGEHESNLVAVIQATTKLGDVVINPYVTDDTIARAMKRSERQGHVFTGDRDKIAVVRAGLSQ